MSAGRETAPIALGTRDRFVLTRGRPEVVRHWVEELFVAHAPRERMARAAAALLPAPLQERALLRSGHAEHAAAVADLTAALESGGGELLRRAGLNGGRPSAWIFLADYAAGQRAGGVAFLFDGGRRPRAVLKLRRRAPGVPSLAREWEALHALHVRLPAHLAASVPAPLAFAEEGGLETLVVSWLPGHSAYVELQTALVPARRLTAQLLPAADWLAAFQRATRGHGGGPRPAEEGEALLAALPRAWDGDRARRRAWLERLRALDGVPALARGASHGDFWARNLLIGGERGAAAGVVDWEGFEEDAPPWRDLFHFPLSHALAYPWGARYRRLPAAAALARGFLGGGELARQLRRYLERWATAAGVPHVFLALLLHLELLDRSRPQAAGGGAEGDPWIDLHLRLMRADRSACSG